MATTSMLRWRRSAAQLHALAEVEKEIRATDPNSRRKYLRDFADAFRTYDSVLKPEQLQSALRAADVLLVGDYHALPASQRYAAQLVGELSRTGKRPLVLGMETIFARHQNVVDEWMKSEIDEQELRERIRFDLDWGYLWEPTYELLESARRDAVPVYGLDAMPRTDLRRIGARDRHAAEKIAELRRQHPKARIMVLFGESHFAPNHLPELLREILPEDRIVTVLQNVDALYWQAAGERRARVDAVRVSEDVVCVFNSTPLEKYESYRICLDRWSQERTATPDFGPSIYNLIESLSRFLNINACSPRNGRQPKFLVDQLPEVYCRTSDETLRKLLQRKITAEAERKAIVARLEEYGSVYQPAMNAVYVRDFQMMHVAEQAASFLHHVCRGAAGKSSDNGNGTLRAEDRFYTRALEDALGYFGSRVLYPARPPERESDLYSLYAQSQDEIEGGVGYAYADYMSMIDFLVLHRDYESSPRRYIMVPAMIQDGVRASGRKLKFLTRRLGYMLGSELYNAYLAGRLSKRFLRSLFFRRLDRPGSARETYFAAVRKAAARRQTSAGKR